MTTQWVISVDDHLVQPPDLWEKRLPARMRERGPRVLRGVGGDPTAVVRKVAGANAQAADVSSARYAAVLTPDKPGDAWSYDGDVCPTTFASAAVGVPREQYSPFPFSYEDLPPQLVDPTRRVEHMDRDGVLASLCFPMSEFPRFCGQSFLEGPDKELGLACVQAYNDFMLEEWCAAVPGRFIPLVLVPLWDPHLAAAEVERTAALGAKAIAFSEAPHKLGLPSIHHPDRHWDPLFGAAEETGMPICTHIGSGSWIPPTAPDAPLLTSLAGLHLIASGTAQDWLLSDVFLRFPRLKLVLSEGGVGWIPYVLGQLDYVWERHGLWTKTPHTEPPSTLFKDHLYGCFIDDRWGAANVRAIGVENCMIETDYPHSDSSWPHTQDLVRQRLAYLTEDERALVLRGNAERVFQFDPADITAADVTAADVTVSGEA